MTTQQMFYETVVPLNDERHHNWSVEVGADYSYAQKTNSVPLTAVEFRHAASEYPIVFTGQDDNIIPVVVIGMRDHENLFVTQSNTWNAKYIPAFVRRYPFVFASSEDGKTLTLCVDESYEGFNQEDRGARLFDEDKKPTPYVENILKFLQEYQAQFERTQAFCRKLKELDLLEPMRADVTLESDEKLTLTGFLAVNRDKLKAVAGDELAKLAQTDELELIYLHLHSMNNFNQMKDRIVDTADDDPAGEPTDDPAPKAKQPRKKKKAAES